jgi:hypothetical protein
MRRLSLEAERSRSHHSQANPYPVPVDLAIGLMLATEVERPLLAPCVSRSRPRGQTSDESMLLAAALAFFESLLRATRSATPMQVWRVECWLRDHRWKIIQFREFLAREKAVQHSIEDSLDGRVIILGRPFFLVYATGSRELWSWPARTRSRFREDEASSLDSISTK